MTKKTMNVPDLIFPERSFLLLDKTSMENHRPRLNSDSVAGMDDIQVI